MSATNDMTSGSPTKDILHFALPLVGGYILQQMYLIIDAAIVGRLVGVGALAAVGASGSVMFLIMGFCNGAGSGFAIPVSQAFGAKDYGAMRAFVANAIRLSVILSVIVTVITCLLCKPILRIINTPSDIFRDAYIFLMIQFASIPLTFAYNLLSGFIRAVGNSRQPFYILIMASFLNVILAFTMIALFGLGVEGVALATMISQAASAALCAIYINRRLRIMIPIGDERKADKKRALTLLNNGIPMGLQFSITAIGSIMLQSANNALGTVYVASLTASMRIKYLFTCVFENIGVAMATYCGQNIGAGKLDRIRKGIWSAIKIMMVYFVITLIIIYPFAENMTALFVERQETEIIANASLFMRISNYFFPILGLLTIFRYSIQGLGYSNLSMMSGVMEMVARCGVSLIVVPAFHFLGVCYGDPMAWIAADLFLIPAFLLLYRHLKRKKNKIPTFGYSSGLGTS